MHGFLLSDPRVAAQLVSYYLDCAQFLQFFFIIIFLFTKFWFFIAVRDFVTSYVVHYLHSKHIVLPYHVAPL